MCGIFAVFQKTKPVSRAAVQIATDTLAHRGPDHSGVHLTTVQTANGEIHAGFGHRRLSIIDLDSRSHQPFCDEGGILTYNGEIYNFADMRDELAKVRPLRTQSDTEVLHRFLAVSGDAALHRFNGMWAFCFLDERRKTVIASRDRYGKKPLFYYDDGDTFCMASEAKAIFSYLGMKPKMRAEKVHRHLASACHTPIPTERRFSKASARFGRVRRWNWIFPHGHCRNALGMISRKRPRVSAATCARPSRTPSCRVCCRTGRSGFCCRAALIAASSFPS